MFAGASVSGVLSGSAYTSPIPYHNGGGGALGDGYTYAGQHVDADRDTSGDRHGQAGGDSMPDLHTYDQVLY
jgi:hypothetical protein